VVLYRSLRPEDFVARSDAQTCRFCAQHDGVRISDPNGYLEITADNSTEITRNGSGLVEFHFCTGCKQLAYAIYLNELSDKSVAVARLALFSEIALEALLVRPTDFAGETLADSRDRRLQYWTPVKC
jgi:hypothetical protein